MLGKRFFKVMFEDNELRVFNAVIVLLMLIAVVYCIVRAVMSFLQLFEINV